MRCELYGLIFETPGITFYLWSPWRSSALEHRLFEVVRGLKNTHFETDFDELRLQVTDVATWQAAIQATERVLKGWQEEGSDSSVPERRIWRWLIEADTDAHGFDHNGDKTSFWGFLRLSLERNGPGEEEKAEDLDLNGFGFRVWNPQDPKSR